MYLHTLFDNYPYKSVLASISAGLLNNTLNTGIKPTIKLNT